MKKASVFNQKRKGGKRMKKVRWCLVLSVFLSFGLVPYWAQAACESDGWMTVNCSETTLNLGYGTHTNGCVVSPTADVDTFTFEGEAGDPVRLVCSGRSYGFDCRIEVWDPEGTQIVSTYCGAYSNEKCSVAEDIVLPMTGSYDVAISDAGNNEIGDYSLNLEELPPDDAGNLFYDNTQSCQLEVTSDVDKWDFEGLAGSTVRLVVSGRTYGLDSVIQVWDPEGNFLDSKSCGAYSNEKCSLSLDVTLPDDGLYSIAVFDSGYNETGSYELQLQCLTGDCPIVENYWPTAPPAEASSLYGHSTAHQSGIMNLLSILVVPMGAVIFMRIFRRKK